MTLQPNRKYRLKTKVLTIKTFGSIMFFYHVAQITTFHKNRDPMLLKIIDSGFSITKSLKFHHFNQHVPAHH